MYTFILITLGLLAILGIVVGVSNDAVNFLNSAFGSKAASRRVILSVAALGILTECVGVVRVGSLQLAPPSGPGGFLSR